MKAKAANFDLMDTPECKATAYVEFMAAAQEVLICMAAAACVRPSDSQVTAHEPLTRLLHRLGSAALGEVTRRKWTARSWTTRSWTTEYYHRSSKQFCSVEKCQSHTGRAQCHYIALAFRALFQLDVFFFYAGISWFEAKGCRLHDVICRHLAAPLYNLPSTT